MVILAFLELPANFNTESMCIYTTQVTLTRHCAHEKIVGVVMKYSIGYVRWGPNGAFAAMCIYFKYLDVLLSECFLRRGLCRRKRFMEMWCLPVKFSECRVQSHNPTTFYYGGCCY